MTNFLWLNLWQVYDKLMELLFCESHTFGMRFMLIAKNISLFVILVYLLCVQSLFQHSWIIHNFLPGAFNIRKKNYGWVCAWYQIGSPGGCLNSCHGDGMENNTLYPYHCLSSWLHNEIWTVNVFINWPFSTDCGWSLFS